MRSCHHILAVLLLAAACSGEEPTEDVLADPNAGTETPAGEDPDQTAQPTEEQQPPVQEPVPPAMRACQLVSVQPVQVTAVATSADAGQVVIRPDGQKPYSITLPQGSPGYLTFEVPDWATEVLFFAPADASYTVAGGTEMHAVRPNTSCPASGITEYRRSYHEWGSHVVEFAATGPRQVWFATFLP
jgi:hypothetical protein